MTLSIGKYCSGAGFGVRGVAEVVMVIPRVCDFHRSVRHEQLLSEDSGGQLASSRTG